MAVVQSLKKFTQQLISASSNQIDDVHQHLTCHRCKSSLAGRRSIIREQVAHCVHCYELQYANICQRCKQPIGVDSSDLCYRNKHWHSDCFSCQACQQCLLESPFGTSTEDDKIYCAACYTTNYATLCNACKDPFRPGSKRMEFRGQQWHDTCFRCTVCQHTIGSSNFVPKNDEIYCIKCYEDKYTTKCTKCRLAILSGGVSFRDQPWHRDCFNCCHCLKSLAGQRYVTCDVNKQQQHHHHQYQRARRQSTTPTNNSLDDDNSSQPSSLSSLTTSNSDPQLEMQPDSPLLPDVYCVDCYEHLFSKQCGLCHLAISCSTYVTSGSWTWHNQCFVCRDCNKSLVGKAFISGGPDTILCGECARIQQQESLKKSIN